MTLTQIADKVSATSLNWRMCRVTPKERDIPKISTLWILRVLPYVKHRHKFLSGAQYVICTVKLDEEKSKHVGLAQESRFGSANLHNLPWLMYIVFEVQALLQFLNFFPQLIDVACGICASRFG